MPHQILISTLVLHNFLQKGIETVRHFHFDDTVEIVNFPDKHGSHKMYCAGSDGAVETLIEEFFEYKIPFSKIKRLYKLLKLIPEQPVSLIINDDEIAIKSIIL